MKPYANVIARLLLLMAMAMLLGGCYWAGPPPDNGDGYYGGYDPGYYGGDVIIGVGGYRDHRDGGRDHRRPDVSHMPGRRLPAPAPRPRPQSRPVGHPQPFRR
jgi:hypothetical protein